MPKRRVEHIMGTAISLEVRDETAEFAAIEAAFESLRAADARFSPFRSDSEVSHLLRGDMEEQDASLELRQILFFAEAMRLRTHGYFDVRGHRSDGRPDPTGLVKGWALEAAAWLLLEGGINDFCLNGGGDIVTRGHPREDEPWRVGIRHPHESQSLATVVGLSGQSIATSGAYERGQHIVDPHRQTPAEGLLSISVIGSSLTTADALATAVFAMGRPGLDWLAGEGGHAFFAVTEADEVVWNEQAEVFLAAARTD